jgi:hypothetical protein
MSDTPPTARRPFNGPVETGLRSLFVLDAISPRSRDLQRLVYFDYLLLHSRDIGDDGPSSIHPAIPYRSGEILVRRELLAKGLELMFSKELVVKQMGQDGVTFSASELCRPFLGYLGSEYAAALRVRARWVAERFEGFVDAELRDYMNANLGRWGAEFNHEAILRHS